MEKDKLQEVLIALKLHALFGYYNAGKKWGRLEYEPGKRKRLEELAFKLYKGARLNG